MILNHLNAMGSSVNLDTMLQGRSDECTGFRVQLDAYDADKLILWWEFFKENRTAENCKVSNICQSAASVPRIKQFVEGDSEKGFNPIDLRTAQNMEPVIVTNDLKSNFLYIIDGSHRTCAQHLSHKDFQDVSAYVCVHPEMLKSLYIPTYYQNLWKL